MNTITITSTTGVRFLARILRDGDRYGLDDRLTVGEGSSLRLEGEGPFVEFFDTRYTHTKHGQFVSRYGVDTILAATGGLDLLTYEPAWKIDSAAMDQVRSWLRQETRPTEQVDDRHYVVGLPVAVTVHPSGAVTLDVDLSEICDVTDDDEAWERYGANVADRDASTVSAAADRLGSTLTFTINPTQEAS